MLTIDQCHWFIKVMCELDGEMSHGETMTGKLPGNIYNQVIILIVIIKSVSEVFEEILFFFVSS